MGVLPNLEQEPFAYLLWRIKYMFYPILRGGGIVQLFILLIVGIIIWQLSIMIRIFTLGASLRSNPSNENISSFISFIRKRWFIPNHPIVWGSLRKTYHTISEIESIDYKLRTELFELLKIKGVIGLYYPKKQNKANI